MRTTTMMRGMVLWLVCGALQAGEADPERLKIDLGVYFITNTSTTLSYVSPASVGVTVNTERDLGMESSLTVFRLNGLYRFNETSALDFGYYAFDRSGEIVLDEELDWGDSTYPVNANLKSRMDRDIFKLSYLWSFHHDDKVELGLSAGLHVSQIRVELDGSLGGSPVASDNTEVTAPLPVVGFILNYRITPDLSWVNKVELFYLKYGDTTGSFTDLRTALEYRFTETLGAGFGVASSRFKVDTDKGDNTFYLDDQLLGLNAYLTLRF